jgi:chromosomal replication initiator protein
MNAQDAWLATLGQLQVQLNRSTYDTWLRRAELLGYEDGRFVVTVPNAYARDWIERHLLPAMTQTLCSIFQRDAEIQIIVWDPVEAQDDQSGPLIEYAHEVEGRQDINPEYAFDSFIVGESNRYACLLARAIAEGQIGRYSPVLFQGGMGVGKTHLLQAIAQGLLERGYSVVYLTAEDFTTELVAAIRGQHNLSFREKFRKADAVILDDLQFVEGKESTQAELVAVWDALRNRQRTMIFASDRLPCDMLKVSKDARSRFQAGPIATIDPPDGQLRLDILDAKCTRRGLTLPPDLRDLIAARIVNSVRDLEGAIEQLHTYTGLTGQPLTRDVASTVLKSLGTAGPVTLDRVLQTVAEYYEVPVEALAGRARTKHIVQARQLAMYLAREETDASLPQIGEALGGRDHSTVVHGCARISELVAADTAVAQEVVAIRLLLAGRPSVSGMAGMAGTSSAPLTNPLPKTQRVSA